jgi:cbb3-type cytochrome oxidase maturation protein
MTLLPAAIAIVLVAIVGASFALAAFFWALRTRQFSIKQMNEGASVIFDRAEDLGTPTDQLFRKPSPDGDERADH